MRIEIVRVIVAFVAFFGFVGIGAVLAGELKHYLQAWLVVLCLVTPFVLMILVASGVFF